MIPYHHQDLLKIMAEHSDKVKLVEEKVRVGHLTPEGATDEIEKWAAQHRWAERLTTIETAANAELSSALTQMEQAFRNVTEPTGDTNTQLLNELRGSRLWERTRRRLDALTDGGAYAQALQQLEISTDPLERSILTQELPVYLASRGHNDQEAAVRDALTKSDPALAESVTNVADTTRAANAALANVHFLREAVTETRHPETLHLRIMDPATA